ncbi:MAG: hypothetical protein QOJ15_200 [Bradyrhizobium sp.]|jgi:hypothetical protein|nr:hypothetical protein [Bradyrhizobium sp.]
MMDYWLASFSDFWTGSKASQCRDRAFSRPTWYVDRSALDLVDATDSVDSAIYYAEVSGWLVGAGEPPQSVAITADGVPLLEECGLI